MVFSALGEQGGSEATMMTVTMKMKTMIATTTTTPKKGCQNDAKRLEKDSKHSENGPPKGSKMIQK